MIATKYCGGLGCTAYPALFAIWLWRFFDCSSEIAYFIIINAALQVLSHKCSLCLLRMQQLYYISLFSVYLLPHISAPLSKTLFTPLALDNLLELQPSLELGDETA